MATIDLFSPIKIGDIELPNRIVMASLTRGRAGAACKANDMMAEYYRQRASGGLLISEAVQISIGARGWYHAPDLFTDEDVKGWKNVTDIVHSSGGRIFCQLWHSGRMSHSSFRKGMSGYEGERAKGIAPSAVKRISKSWKQNYTPGGEEVDVETPREMTKHDIQQVINEFLSSAKKAKESNFDGIELHAGNGYLLDEFLQSCTNHRTDEYGGSLENRFRIVDVLLSELSKIWKSTQIGIRFSPNSTFNDMGSHDNYDAFMYYATRANQYNLAYIHMIIGQDEKSLVSPYHGLSKTVTPKDIRSVYKGNIMVNEGFTKETGNQIIQSGHADIVAFGRLFLANPDLVERFKKNAALSEPDYKTFFSSVNHHPRGKGYTDYPTLKTKKIVFNGSHTG